MATNQPPVTYPPRFFPQGMRVHLRNTPYVFYVDRKDSNKVELLFERGGEKDFYPAPYSMLTPKPDGVLGFNPEMYAALVAGRKTQITVPIKKKLFKAGDIVRVGEAWFDLPHTRVDTITYEFDMLIFTSEFQCITKLPDIFRKDFCPQWSKPETLPFWATRHFIRITGVETKAPCEFTDSQKMAEGIILDPNVNGYTFKEGNWYGGLRRAFRDLWLSLHPKDGEQTFEQPHTVYTFELIKYEQLNN